MDLQDDQPNFYVTMELSGFWLKIDANKGMVLPTIDSYNDNQIITNAENIGL